MSNPTLERLGFKPDDRVVIVHADDVGMCHAANAAFWEDQAAGLVTCGAVMMPCPWVAEMADWCRAHPEADVGVHLTLTSEWEGYRWGPLSTRDPKSGMVDEQGYLWRSNEEVYTHMDADAAIAELRAQVEHALALGIDVTHIDTHMGTVMHPDLLPAYIQLAIEYRLPAMLPMIPRDRVGDWGISPEHGEVFWSAMQDLVATGFPVLDWICSTQAQDDHLAGCKRLFDSVPVGVTHLLLHPSVPGSDVEAITNSAAYRIDDYRTFLRPELRAHVEGQGIHTIGYRQLRDLIRG